MYDRESSPVGIEPKQDKRRCDSKIGKEKVACLLEKIHDTCRIEYTFMHYLEGLNRKSTSNGLFNFLHFILFFSLYFYMKLKICI